MIYLHFFTLLFHLAAGQGQAEGSYEYLVFNSTLLGVAAAHGLHALTDWEDPDLDDCFDEVLSLLLLLSVLCRPKYTLPCALGHEHFRMVRSHYPR